MNLVHGEYGITVDDNIISIAISEAFNEYCIIQLTAELKLIVSSFPHKAFFLIVDLLNSEGGTPEAFEESRKCNLWLDQQNIIAKAILSDSSTFIAINEARLRRTDKQLIQYFHTRSDAIHWFNSLL